MKTAFTFLITLLLTTAVLGQSSSKTIKFRPSRGVSQSYLEGMNSCLLDTLPVITFQKNTVKVTYGDSTSTLTVLKSGTTDIGRKFWHISSPSVNSNGRTSPDYIECTLSKGKITEIEWISDFKIFWLYR